MLNIVAKSVIGTTENNAYNFVQQIFVFHTTASRKLGLHVCTI